MAFSKILRAWFSEIFIEHRSISLWFVEYCEAIFNGLLLFPKEIITVHWEFPCTYNSGEKALIQLPSLELTAQEIWAHFDLLPWFSINLMSI